MPTHQRLWTERQKRLIVLQLRTTRRQEKLVIDWTREFPITSVSRTDLLEAGFTEQQIASLTDEDMLEIASEMEDWYCDNGFWIDIENVVQNRLDKKTQPLGESNEAR